MIRLCLGVLPFALVACGDSVGFGGGATATIQLQNTTTDTTMARADFVTPAVYEVKLIAVYLTEGMSEVDGSNVDVNGDGYNTSMIYQNTQCEDDLMHCDVSGGTAEDGADMDKVITDYFDFAQNSIDVNLDLNAQTHSIDPQTYAYIRMEFCKYNSESATTLRWGSNNDDAQEETHCNYAAVEFDDPLVVEKGDDVLVNVSYDLSNVLVEGDEATGSYCVGEGDSRQCFTDPEFVPSATLIDGTVSALDE